MIRINLLPPEIIERRKYELFYPYVFIATAILVGVVLVSWLGLQLIVNQRTDDLQKVKTSTAQLEAQAESFAVFERKQQELEARQQVATTALAGRVDMGRLAEDISLVLPDEVYATRLKCSELTGMELEANATMSREPAVKQGYRSVAATLVRLAALEQLSDVWLNTAEVQKVDKFQPAVRSQGESGTVMYFSSTGDIRALASTAQDE